jgi:uncharacterized protein (TIGR03435 family)
VKDGGLKLAVRSAELFLPRKSTKSNGPNFPIATEVNILPLYFSKPVILQPDLSGNYDLTFQWDEPAAIQQALSNELAQAGLELVPTNVPTELLVVEKAR